MAKRPTDDSNYHASFDPTPRFRIRDSARRRGRTSAIWLRAPETTGPARAVFRSACRRDARPGVTDLSTTVTSGIDPALAARAATPKGRCFSRLSYRVGLYDPIRPVLPKTTLACDLCGPAFSRGSAGLSAFHITPTSTFAFTGAAIEPATLWYCHQMLHHLSYLASYDDEAGRNLDPLLRDRIALTVCALGVNPPHCSSRRFRRFHCRAPLAHKPQTYRLTRSPSASGRLTIGAGVIPPLVGHFQPTYPIQGTDRRCSLSRPAVFTTGRPIAGRYSGLPGWTGPKSGDAKVAVTPLRRLPAAALTTPSSQRGNIQTSKSSATKIAPSRHENRNGESPWE